ncbi:UNVERIFIED_CONTAM: hypothetical protein Sradi_3003500 [Sesamum radiatum]|uniref:Reverse transcriptase Ty1/copia-type domain-containing protein n=1 Tax=Sesamum radiatum TaxID=300843 RepID=A0AAW2S1W4_SESRA
MNQPEGFTSVGEEQKVWRLQRSIYGLKLAFRSWNTRFDEVIWGYDFIKMKNSKRGFLAIRHGIKLSKKQSPNIDKALKMMSDIPYALAVGSIHYIVQCTRPDVAYSLSVTSRYQAYAGEAHWSPVKIILKYLKRTKDMFFVTSIEFYT